MYYYKLKPAITSLDDLTISAHADMHFMMHVDFYIARETPLDLNRPGNFKYFGWTISKRDIELIERPEISSVTYFLSNGDTVRASLFRLEYLEGHKSSLYSKELSCFMKNLIVPPIRDRRAAQLTLGPVEAKTLNFYDDYLTKQIKNRYLCPIQNMHIWKKNSVVDSLLPKALLDNEFATPRGHSSVARYSISPFTSRMLGTTNIPTNHLCRVLGYSEADITSLITKVNSKHFNVIFAGMGGTGINTIYWLNELMTIAALGEPLFSRIEVFEKESADLSNLLRFPLDPLFISSKGTNKMTLSAELVKKLAVSTSFKHDYFPREDNFYDTPLVYSRSMPSKGFLKPERTVVYGAPNLASREKLSSLGNFISATHADLSCSMHLNPTQYLDVQVESYGTIQLTPFFMNQLKMAITFLEILASDIDLSAKDQHLLEYQFDGTSKDPTLPYVFPILENTPTTPD